MAGGETEPQGSGDMQPDSLGERLADALGWRKAARILNASTIPGPVMLARYEILAHVGEGGMNLVFEAHDPELDRRVAIKACKAATREAAALIEHEARSLAKLEHPNVVQVFDVVREGSDVAIVMQFIEGETLRAWQRRTTPHWRDVLACYVKAGEALAAVHAAGLEHADFKPDNVLIDSQGRVRVIDFGLGLHSSQPDDEQDQDERPNVGTREYMAPERLMEKPGGAPADVYAFCVSAWESLFGVRPFGAPEHPTGTAVLSAIEAGKPRMGRTPGDLPAGVREVLRKGFAWEPSDRHSSMEAVLHALRVVLGDEPPLQHHGEGRLAPRELEHRGRLSWLRTPVLLAVLVCVGGTMAIAGVCTLLDPVNQALGLAADEAHEGAADNAVQYLELAHSRARRNHDEDALRRVADESIRVAELLAARSELDQASYAWGVARDVYIDLRDQEGLRRIEESIARSL